MRTDELLRAFDLHVGTCRGVMEAKNQDYGSSWEEMRPTSITDQILVKVKRIKQLEDLAAKGEAPKVSEGIESELRDIVNYSIMRLIQERAILVPMQREELSCE